MATASSPQQRFRAAFALAIGLCVAATASVVTTAFLEETVVRSDEVGRFDFFSRFAAKPWLLYIRPRSGSFF